VAAREERVMLNVKNSPAGPEGAEGTICDTCRTIPISYLSLDVDEPVDGWLAFFGEKNIVRVVAAGYKVRVGGMTGWYRRTSRRDRQNPDDKREGH
jgi:hypothetical protein